MNSTSDLAGQVLTIGLDGLQLGPENRELFASVHPGGVIYFQRNIESAEQFHTLVAESRNQLNDSAPFLALDLEGGSVDRFRQLIAPLPAAGPIAAQGLGRELGRVAGRELAAFGLNVDFAPVLDLTLHASEKVLADRTAGGSPEEVVQFATEFLDGLSESGIWGCGKHFPGLGGGTLDSHLEMPRIGRSFDEMWDQDLRPYRDLAKLLPMVMVAHAWYPNLEQRLGWSGAERPASDQSNGRMPAWRHQRVMACNSRSAPSTAGVSRQRQG